MLTESERGWNPSKVQSERTMVEGREKNGDLKEGMSICFAVANWDARKKERKKEHLQLGFYQLNYYYYYYFVNFMIQGCIILVYDKIVLMLNWYIYLSDEYSTFQSYGIIKKLLSKKMFIS